MPAFVMLFLHMLPMIIGAIKDGEEIYKGWKQGSVKKQAVLDLVSNTTKAISTAHPGLITDTDRSLLLSSTGSFVDVTVDGFNASGFFKHTIEEDTSAVLPGATP